MMRVLHVLRQLNPGGIECWLERLQRHWPVNSRPEFHFALEEADFGSLAPRMQAHGAILHYCPGARNIPSAASRLLSILADHGPFAAIHCHNHHASTFHLSLAAQMGVPIRIAQSHADFRPIRAGDSALRAIYTRSARAALRLVANIRLAVSAGASADLFGAGAKGVRLLPCGIDFQAYAGLGARRDPSRFTLVHVGRLVPEKNHAHLLRVTAKLLEREAGARLWLIGDGPLRGQLEAHAESLGIARNVHFWGSRPDVPDLMAQADVFVFPSLAEGLGLAAIEAQAAGLPVVMSEHLPAALDIFPQLCTRLALDLPMERWVDALTAARESVVPDAAQRFSRLSQSEFSIHSNIRSLHEIYAGPTH